MSVLIESTGGSIQMGTQSVGGQISRFDLLRRGARPQPAAMRPPWAGTEASFVRQCTACEACITECPEKILKADGNRRPLISFEDRGCTLCGKCADVCEPAALKMECRQPFQHTVSIGADCISVSGTACRLCEEQCDEDAITFKPALRGRSIPFVASTNCNGCGACFSVCPADAIKFQPSLMEVAE